MDSAPPYETKSGLLARAREAGYPLTERRLKRWHPLLPGSGQGHFTGVRGSETLYPPGTGDQLLVICDLRWEKRVWRLKDLGWRLWWRGCQVDPKFWKPHLEQLARWYDKIAPTIMKLVFPRGDDEISNVGFGLFAKLRSAKTRVRSTPFRQLRKRIRNEDWETLMRFLFEIQRGQFTGLSGSSDSDDPDLKRDQAILDRGLGLHRARTDQLNGGSPWLEGDIDEPLVRVSRAISKHHSLVAVLADTPGDELLCARDELVTILRCLTVAARGHEATRGKHAFGLSVAADIAQRAGSDVHGLMLLWWLVFRKDQAVREQIKEFMERSFDRAKSKK